ncbi:MAG: tRNA-dihydrouridine synthase family protein [Synergistaceae bacterium]|jgi:tRNA-dihydrouridine synthase B|nr:tRNA-dihydrouridine synthase family protein [Synergistaceae bacterium]
MDGQKSRIGGVEADSPIWLAPLAGVTSRTFREFHRRLGAGLVHTEMISAIGLSYRNRRTKDMIGDDGETGPVALQLFAPNADELVKGAEIALGARRFEAVEINMACPMPKVTKRGAGARLLENPSEAGRMVSALRPFGLPVWVKLRKTSPQGTRDFCRMLVDSGADLLMLHGRTPAQRYDGAADKGIISGMAAEFPGMLVASGDFYEPEDARLYLDAGCVAVLAARGALRDAFLIPRTLSALGYEVGDYIKKYVNPTPRDQLEAVISVGRAGLAREGERFAVILARRMLAGMFKGFPGAAAIRRECSSHKKWPAMEEFLTRQNDIML